MTLGQRTEGGEALENGAALEAIGVELVVSPERRENAFQRTRFKRPDPVPIYQSPVVESPTGGSGLGHLDLAGRPRHFVHGQIDRVEEAPASREVRAGLLRMGRTRRVQGIDQHHAGPEGLRPGADPVQIGQIPYPPARPGSGRVKLGRETPERFGRDRRPTGAHHHAVHRSQSGFHQVIAGRQIRREPLLDLQLPAILEDQAPGRDGRKLMVEPDGHQGWRWRSVVSCTHGGQHRFDGGFRGRAPLPLHVPEPAFHAPGA